MARGDIAAPVLTELPAGVEFVKYYRDGRMLVECHHAPEHRGPRWCLICKYGPCSTFLGYDAPVKMVVRKFGRYPKWAGVDSKRLRTWLRHWRKQVELGHSDLVYDPEEEVRMLTEELRSRGDL